MRHLIEKVDERGYKFLASSDDGTRLLTDQNCGACCNGGPCSRVYAFNACCLNSVPQTVYVCSDALCGSTPMAEVFRIVVGSACYVRGAQSPVATTPSMTVLDGPDIDSCDHGGCSSPECVDYCGNRFIPGVLCTGQDDYAGPPIYILLDGEQSCGVLNVGWACFKFDPAVSVPESEVPGNATRLDSALLWGPQNPNCCACLPGCIETVQTVTECSLAGPTDVERRCCCTNRRDVTIEFESRAEYHPDLSFVLTRTIEGSGFAQFDDTNSVISSFGEATVTELNRDGSTNQFTVPISPVGGCLPFPNDPYLVAFRPFEWVTSCDFFNESGGNTARAQANIVRTCANGLHAGAWTLRRNAGIPGDPLSGQIIQSGGYDSRISVTYFGRCSGGCDADAAGRAGVLVSRGSNQTPLAFRAL